MPDWFFLVTIGIILIIVGFFMLAFGTMRPVHEVNREEKVKGGGVILIGPVPVVFGSDKRYALIAMLLAIVLMILVIIFGNL